MDKSSEFLKTDTSIDLNNVPNSDEFRINPDDMVGEFDDASLAYMIQIQDGFDALRVAATQISGLIVLTLSSEDRIVGNQSLEIRAGLEIAEAESIIAPMRPTDRTKHHYYHLTRAFSDITKAYQRFKNARVPIGETELDLITGLLKQGWTELGHASRALPGFALVDFSQSCCAFHSKQLQT